MLTQAHGQLIKLAMNQESMLALSQGAVTGHAKLESEGSASSLARDLALFSGVTRAEENADARATSGDTRMLLRIH
jgi:hypothetical protein